MNDLHLQYRRETGHQVKIDDVKLVEYSWMPEHYLIEVCEIRDFIPDMHNPTINMIDPEYVEWLQSKINMLQPNQP